MPQAFRKTAHRELRRGVSGLPRRRDDAKNAGEVDDMGFALARKMRQERARAVHHAPEIDVHEPVHLRLVDLVEVADQRDAGIVDEDVEGRVGRRRGMRERLDLLAIADIDAVHGNPLRMGAADLGGDGLQAGLVAIRQRQVAAARGKFNRERPADPAGGACHGRSRSTYGSHFRSAPEFEESADCYTSACTTSAWTEFPYYLCREPNNSPIGVLTHVRPNGR